MNKKFLFIGFLIVLLVIVGCVKINGSPINKENNPTKNVKDKKLPKHIIEIFAIPRLLTKREINRYARASQIMI